MGRYSSLFDATPRGRYHSLFAREDDTSDEERRRRRLAELTSPDNPLRLAGGVPTADIESVTGALPGVAQNTRMQELRSLVSTPEFLEQHAGPLASRAADAAGGFVVGLGERVNQLPGPVKALMLPTGLPGLTAGIEPGTRQEMLAAQEEDREAYLLRGASPELRALLMGAAEVGGGAGTAAVPALQISRAAQAIKAASPVARGAIGVGGAMAEGAITGLGETAGLDPASQIKGVALATGLAGLAGAGPVLGALDLGPLSKPLTLPGGRRILPAEAQTNADSLSGRVGRPEPGAEIAGTGRDSAAVRARVGEAVDSRLATVSTGVGDAVPVPIRTAFRGQSASAAAPADRLGPSTSHLYGEHFASSRSYAQLHADKYPDGTVVERQLSMERPFSAEDDIGYSPDDAVAIHQEAGALARQRSIEAGGDGSRISGAQIQKALVDTYEQQARLDGRQMNDVLRADAIKAAGLRVQAAGYDGYHHRVFSPDDGGKIDAWAVFPGKPRLDSPVIEPPDAVAPTGPPSRAPRAQPAGDRAMRAASPFSAWAQKWWTSRGRMPVAGHEARIAYRGEIAARMNRIEALNGDLNRAMRRVAKASPDLTPKMLARYVDDSLRGMNIRTGGDALDEVQIARIAKKRGISPDVVRQHATRQVADADAGMRAAPELVPIVREMRTHLDGLTREMRRGGLLDDAASKELERHYGLYMHRQYEAYRNPKYAAKAEQQLTGLDRALQENAVPEEWATRFQVEPLWRRAYELTAAKFPDKTPGEVLGLLSNYTDRTPGRTVLPGGAPEGAKDLSSLRHRAGLDDLRRMLLGEVREGGANFFTSASKMAALIEEQKFLDDFARTAKEGGFASETPTRRGGVAYDRQIDPNALRALRTERGSGAPGEPGLDRLVVSQASPRTKLSPGEQALGALYTSADVLDELHSVFASDAFPEWARAYMGLNYGVKFGATAGSLQSANRNFLSNFLYVLANGVNPLNPARFWRAGKLSYPRVFGNTDRAMMADVERLQRLGLFDQGSDLGDLKRLERQTLGAAVDRTPTSRIGRGVRTAMDFMGELYNAPDNFAKAYVLDALVPQYEKALGVTREVAEEHVARNLRATMQNYGEVPRGIRITSSQVPVFAPFLTFSEEVVRNLKNVATLTIQEAQSPNPALQRLALKRAVGVVGALSLPYATKEAVNWALNTGGDDEENARHFVPPWSKPADLIILPAEQGKLGYVDLGFMDTFAGLKQPFFAILRGDFEGAQAALSKPFGEEILAGALMDVRSNEKPTGGQIYNPEDTWLGRQTDKLQYLARVAEPGTARSAQRILESMDSESPRVLWQELVAVLGPRVTTIDVGRSLEFKAREWQDRATDARRLELSAVYRNEDAEAGGEKAAERLDEIAREITDSVAAARDFATEGQIAQSLAKGDMPGWMVTAAMSGDYQGITHHLMDLNQRRILSARQQDVTGGMDVWGNEITHDSTAQRPAHLDAELLRIGKPLTFVEPRVHDPKLDGDRTLTKEEYRIYQQAAGQMAQRRLEPLFAAETYQAADLGAQQRAVERAVRAAREYGRMRVFYGGRE